MPVNPVVAENSAPNRNATERATRRPTESAGSARSTKKITTTNTPSVLNWRRR
jgi:hypothetical protein